MTTVPEDTKLPCFFSIGIASPVTDASSTFSKLLLRIRPSTGMTSPLLTFTMSPGCKSLIGTVSWDPSGPSLVACVAVPTRLSLMAFSTVAFTRRKSHSETLHNSDTVAASLSFPRNSAPARTMNISKWIDRRHASIDIIARRGSAWPRTTTTQYRHDLVISACWKSVRAKPTKKVRAWMHRKTRETRLFAFRSAIWSPFRLYGATSFLLPPPLVSTCAPSNFEFSVSQT
mmetsp:Transcript_108764/g.198058  ORF Transcript_108764/g.198058 Transcript_108764/m.198058 type:complete len:230 (-) Transcript_108764:195-884(-)